MVKNKSVTYILPLFCKYFVSCNVELQEAIFVNYLENCYSFSRRKENICKNFIIKINKPKENNILFDNFIVNLKNSNIFVNYIEDSITFAFEFTIPSIIKESYDNFIEGKYSEIKESDKKIILEFVKKNISTDMSVKIMRVFSKSSLLREELEKQLGMKIPIDIELSSKPNETNETFNIL